MIKPIKTLVVLAFMTAGMIQAQNFKFGKVSEAEVQEKEHPVEKEAEAAYLYRYRNTYYSENTQGTILTTEVHQRIKIYTDEGFPYAQFEMRLYEKDDWKEDLQGLKAYTYNMENGKLEEYKLEKSDIFEEKIDQYRTKVTFTMPKVKEGSVVEVRYRIVSTYFFDVDPFEFQFGIPVNKLEAKFSAPESFVFNPKSKGYYFVSPEIGKKHNPHTQTLDVVYKFDQENVPSLKAEAYVDNIANYRAAMSFELAQISIPGSYYKSYSQTWEDVTKSIYKAGVETQLNKKGYFKDDLEPVLQGVSTPEEKVTAIFEFVKSKMNWNEVYGYMCPDGVRQAYNEGVGNVAEINLMLVAMLRYAGVKANPVLVSTKSHGIPLFPTTDGFNYLIAAAELESGAVLLDATSKMSVPNILPYRVLNWDGRLIREDESSASIDLSARVKAAKEVTLMVQLNEDGSLKGRLRNMYANHSAFDFREDYYHMDEEEYLQEFENRYVSMEVENYSINNKQEVYKPVVENIEFQKEASAEIISGKMFVSPMLFFRQQSNPFTSEERSYPIDFQYPESFVYNINIMIPQGYQVESLPESAKFVLPDNLGSFVYQIASGGNTVQLRVRTDFNQDVVPADYYKYIKEFFGAMIEKQAEKVVLSKV